MAILILTEGGTTRRFNLRPGRLSFGSGPDVTLKLSSDDVAERHGVIEMGEGGAVLRIGKGVLPAQVAGKAVGDEHVFREGQPVKVGSATLSVEYGEGEGPPAAAAPVVRSGSRGSATSTPRTRGRGRAAAADEEEERPRRRVQRKSDPTGILIAIGLVVVLGGTAYYFITKATKGLSGGEFVYATAYNRALRGVETDPIASRRRFEEILTQPSLTSDQRRQVEQQIEKLKEPLAAADESVRNARGDSYLDIRLKKFADGFDVTESRPHARVFLKRAKWFMGEYPTHPENEWIERMMARVTPVADPSSPTTIEDLRVDVWGEVDKEPKDFIAAEEAIDRFVAQTNNEREKAEAETLRRETRAAEGVWYTERLADAKASYSKDEFPQQYNWATAANDVIKIMVSCQDPAKRADGAERLLKIRELNPEHLERNYKLDRKHYWSRMIEVPVFRAWAQEKGLL